MYIAKAYACMHAYIHAYMDTHIHTYIHTHTHTKTKCVYMIVLSACICECIYNAGLRTENLHFFVLAFSTILLPLFRVQYRGLNNCPYYFGVPSYNYSIVGPKPYSDHSGPCIIVPFQIPYSSPYRP